MARECGALSGSRPSRTAAIRDAPNRDELCAAVVREAGVEVAILSGDDEARLAFAGATRMLQHAPLGTIAVVDVGGGSSEIVVGTMAGGVHVVGVVSRRLRVPGRPLPALRPAGHRRARQRPPPRRRRVRGTVRRRRRRRLRGRRQRDVAAAPGRRRAQPRDARTAASGCSARRPVALIAQRFELHPERVRVHAGGDDAARRGVAACSACRCGSRRADCARGSSWKMLSGRWRIAWRGGKSPQNPGSRAGRLPFGAGRVADRRRRAPTSCSRHADGVLDTSDIERVHDMRVATRRLRAVLEVYAPCFPRKRHAGRAARGQATR